MAKKVFFNVCELQEISYEFRNKLRLMDTLNEKLKRAKKMHRQINRVCIAN